MSGHLWVPTGFRKFVFGAACEFDFDLKIEQRDVPHLYVRLLKDSTTCSNKSRRSTRNIASITSGESNILPLEQIFYAMLSYFVFLCVICIHTFLCFFLYTLCFWIIGITKKHLRSIYTLFESCSAKFLKTFAKNI